MLSLCPPTKAQAAAPRADTANASEPLDNARYSRVSSYVSRAGCGITLVMLGKVIERGAKERTARALGRRIV